MRQADTRGDLASELAEWVEDRFGLQLPRERQLSLLERISAEAGGASALLQAVRRNEGAAVGWLAAQTSTTYTFFFREPESFEFLAQEVVPAIPRRGPVRWWSAAASSGEEAYSMAMVLRETAPELARVTRILGTDLNPVQLRLAERARYGTASSGPLGDRALRWATEVEPGVLELAGAIRELCTFRRLNLVDTPWPFQQRFHVIFLRNVLYYFSEARQARIVAHAHEFLEPGGWLFTSQTDPVLPLDGRWGAAGPGRYRRLP